MNEYHKIQTVFKRDPDTKFKTLLEGQYSLPEFEYLKDNEWVFTEKVDGTNIRVMWDGESVTFGGKTDRAQIPSNLVTHLNEEFMTISGRTKLKDVFGADSACLYGEGYGAGIQKGGNYRPDQAFVLFDVRCGDWWLQRKDVKDAATKLCIDVVPIVDTGPLELAVSLTRAGINSAWNDFTMEGLVMRPATELKTRSGHRVITKIKHKDFRPVPV